MELLAAKSGKGGKAKAPKAAKAQSRKAEGGDRGGTRPKAKAKAREGKGSKLTRPRCAAFCSTRRGSSRPSALLSMNWRRGSTSSPISVVKISPALIASSICTLQQDALRRVHRGFPELLGIHLAQPLVALDRHDPLRLGEQPVERLRLKIRDRAHRLAALHLRVFADQARQHLAPSARSARSRRFRGRRGRSRSPPCCRGRSSPGAGASRRTSGRARCASSGRWARAPRGTPSRACARALLVGRGRSSASPSIAVQHRRVHRRRQALDHRLGHEVVGGDASPAPRP